jgi:hypothetical protein
MGTCQTGHFFHRKQTKEKQAGKVRGCNAEWHGFVSSSGVGKTSQKAIKKNLPRSQAPPLQTSQNLFPAKN